MLNFIIFNFNYMYLYLMNFCTYIINTINFYYSYSRFIKNVNIPSLIYIRNILIVLFIDCLIIDDEPLWEPIEWSLVQTWLLFLFFFAWIAETIISSNYGSFTGRDKRVYTGLFKAFWLFEIWFNINILLTCLFVIVPFYFELTYTVSYISTWWIWYNRLFFLKFLIVWLIIDYLSIILLQSLKWLNWKKLLMLVFMITFFLFFLFFSQFITAFFSYFTDIMWYKKTSWCDYNKLSQGPQKWGWGEYDRDHFNYHKTTTCFWFKNDSLYASALFFINIFTLMLIFFVTIQWILILRKIWTTRTVSYTFLTYGLSTLKMYFTMIMFLFVFIIISILYQFIRIPSELTWVVSVNDFYLIIYNNLMTYMSIF